MPKICIIAAMGENRVIGSAGKIPWRLPADFKRFKEITMGYPVIMGRKTFESIGNPLPGRANIVITRDANYHVGGICTATSLEEALSLPEAAAEKIFILGGGEIYRLAFKKADVLYLTKVHGTFEGDTFFPEFNEAAWRLVASEERPKDERNPFDMTFLVYERKI